MEKNKFIEQTLKGLKIKRGDPRLSKGFNFDESNQKREIVFLLWD